MSFSTSQDAKESQWTNALFFKDKAGELSMEESDPTYSGSNQGLQRRWEFTNSGDEVEMESILMTDLAFQEKLIIINKLMWASVLG